MCGKQLANDNDAVTTRLLYRPIIFIQFTGALFGHAIVILLLSSLVAGGFSDLSKFHCHMFVANETYISKVY